MTNVGVTRRLFKGKLGKKKGSKRNEGLFPDPTGLRNPPRDKKIGSGGKHILSGKTKTSRVYNGQRAQKGEAVPKGGKKAKITPVEGRGKKKRIMSTSRPQEALGGTPHSKKENTGGNGQSGGRFHLAGFWKPGRPRSHQETKLG